VPLEYLVAELDAADSRYMKVYSGSAVAVVIPISVVIPVPAGVHVHIAPVRAVAVVIPISVVAPLRAVHPAIAVNADFTATPLRAGRAGKQHRGSQGRNGCSK
jgi:hypothetical protein